MKEEPISFEVAVLAAEKGFPQERFNTAWYNELGTYLGRTDLNKDGKSYQEVCRENALFTPADRKDEFSIKAYLAPSQSLVQRWLREERNVDIYAYVIEQFHNSVPVPSQDREYSYRIIVQGISMFVSVDEMFDTYEQAVDKGLKESLKLLS